MTVLAWFGAFWLACATVAAALMFTGWLAARRAEEAECRRRHPSGQQMPRGMREWLHEVIAEVEAERIDEEWAAISRAVGDE